MFNISNTRKVGDLSFHTAKGRNVILHPLVSRNFEVDDLNVGLLRVMIGKGSHYKVRADSEEAEDLVKLAQERKPKPFGSPIVHGSADVKPEDFVSIRDMKKPRPERVFIREEQKPETPEQPHPAHPPAPPPAPEAEKTPMEKLIATASELPFTEFRTQAKELLGDDFPNGNPGRPALIEALKAKQVADLSAKAQAE